MKKLLSTLAAATGLCAAAYGQHPTDVKITSRLEIYDTETGTRTLLKEYPYLIEAPNWTMDGRALVYNSGGKIYRVEVDAPGNDAPIPTGGVTRSNNDHMLSMDGRGLAISSGTADDWRSRIYVVGIEGGEPRLVTPNGPSYLHGWSPDGKWLSYCADREGDFDVWAIPVDGSSPEVRLTTAEGLDDGPEYSPDGRHIWFNSVRSGLMQVWRMNADGSDQRQMTFDEGRNSWFPHVSADGRKVVFIAYAVADVAPGDHPAGKNVELRLMSARGDDEWGEPFTVVRLFGGQGTINVHSWAPDSRRFAFVSYVYGE
jgi:Tol biopolymer transport system component